MPFESRILNLENDKKIPDKNINIQLQKVNSSPRMGS
jgi:hypothetical protein